MGEAPGVGQVSGLGRRIRLLAAIEKLLVHLGDKRLLTQGK